MASIELNSIDKNYHAVEVIRDLNLTINDGEFVVVVGPSGCGKTTLLRMLAGLEAISGGDLIIGDRRANDLPPQQRNIAMVFQTYALFPHMTVRQNIAFGPEVRGEKSAAIEEKVQRAAEILNISSYLSRKPSELSGGQRQRVAMGRAIVRESDVFLFDEPLSNLDAHLRVEMRTEIKALHQKLGATIVYVTHDQIEAMTMADRIVIMNEGRIEQVGPPTELYDHPRNVFVAGFLGSPAMNFLPGVPLGEGAVSQIRLDDGAKVPIQEKSFDCSELLLGVRPEAFNIEPGGPFSFHVQVIEPTGSEVLVYGDMFGHGVRCVFSGRPVIAVGDVLDLSVDPEYIHVFDRSTGMRL